jgi:membrane-associated phospholipid phosphatase
LKISELLIRDETISSKLKIIDTDHFLKPFAVIFAHSGDSWLWFAGLVVLFIFGSPFWRYEALVMTVSFIGLAVIVLGIKFTVRRQRPEGEWGQIYRITDPHSFPSGHAARAFLFATLSIGLGPVWLAILLVIWAPLVSLARVATGLHYLSDILVGMMVGILAGGVILLLLPTIQPLLQMFLALFS